MKKIQLLLVLNFLFLLCSCNIAPDEIVSAPTEIVIPTSIPTATPIPLSEINIEPFLIQANDLPPQLNGSQVRDQTPEIVPGIPQPINQIYQAFGRTDGGIVFEKSGIYVFIYNDLEAAKYSYQFVLKAMQEGRTHGAVPKYADPSKVHAENEVGEESAWMKAPFMNFEPVTDLAWRNCNAVFYVRMVGDSDVANAYARRLNERLTPLICR
jgi:hypothetical protein